MTKRIAIISVLFVLLAINVALSDDTVTKFQCGEAFISIYNSNVQASPFFVVTVLHKDGWSHYPYLVENEFFDARCEKNKAGEEFLLINHTCGGSGCTEANYGLIKIDHGVEALKPRKPGPADRGNADEAASILGKTVRPFSCSKRARTFSVPNDKGEYCLMSPLELG